MQSVPDRYYRIRQSEIAYIRGCLEGVANVAEAIREKSPEHAPICEELAIRSSGIGHLLRWIERAERWAD